MSTALQTLKRCATIKVNCCSAAAALRRSYGKDTITCSSFNQNISIFIGQILDSTIGHVISANHVAIYDYNYASCKGGGSRSLSLFFIGLNSLLSSHSL